MSQIKFETTQNALHTYKAAKPGELYTVNYVVTSVHSHENFLEIVVSARTKHGLKNKNANRLYKPVYSMFFSRDFRFDSPHAANSSLKDITISALLPHNRNEQQRK